MAPTIEESPRRCYRILLTADRTAEVLAETVCEPTKDSPYFVFKLDGVVVAKFKTEVVEGWYIEGRQ